jgi:hypothetical protein
MAYSLPFVRQNRFATALWRGTQIPERSCANASQWFNPKMALESSNRWITDVTSRMV